MSTKRFAVCEILRVRDGRGEVCADRLAVEEPLEIQLATGSEALRLWKTVAITMRTPGHDRELAAGFLVGEGLLGSINEVEAVHSLGGRDVGQGWQHQVRVTLRPGVTVDLARLERNFYTTSSCGVCGKTSLEALEMNVFSPVTPVSWKVAGELISSLPTRLREAQEIFDQTGGLHAAGLFTPEGETVLVREDVGRHNAVDKVIGSEFLLGRAPLMKLILVVSGRASFELVQKAVAAGIPMLVAVGAPSSLAVAVAKKFGVTLVGFTKSNGFNVYTGRGRVSLESGEQSLPRRSRTTVLQESTP